MKWKDEVFGLRYSRYARSNSARPRGTRVATGVIHLLAGIHNKMALVWIECGQGVESAIHGSLRTRFKLQRTTVTSSRIVQ